MVRRATKKDSQSKKRQTKKILVLAAEGSNKTEKTYFNEFNAKQNEFRIIHARGNNTDPVKIVQDAINTAAREEVDYKYGDRAAAVFDVDFGKENQIIEAIELANKNSIDVYLSNPCFEVWLLLHYRYSTKSYINNGTAINDLMKHWPRYEKSIDSFSHLDNLTDTAITNAKKVKEHFLRADGIDDVMRCNSSTDVHELVEMLLN